MSRAVIADFTVGSSSLDGVDERKIQVALTDGNE
jgi:hypothetical protein